MYKSGDKELLGNFKQYLKENINEDTQAQYGWNFFYKHLFIDDTNKYVRLKTANRIVEVGYGNFNSPVVFVVRSMKDKACISFLRTLLGNLKMNFNSTYVTSFYKTEVDDKPLYDKAIKMELDCIAPKVVFSMGDYGIQDAGYKVIVLDSIVLQRMLDLTGNTNLTDEEKIELQESKRIVWSKLKEVVKYYSN